MKLKTHSSYSPTHSENGLIQHFWKWFSPVLRLVRFKIQMPLSDPYGEDQLAMASQAVWLTAIKNISINQGEFRLQLIRRYLTHP